MESRGGLPESLQVSYLESNEGLFRTLAGWLIEDNRLEEANQIMDLMDVFQSVFANKYAGL